MRRLGAVCAVRSGVAGRSAAGRRSRALHRRALGDAQRALLPPTSAQGHSDAAATAVGQRYPAVASRGARTGPAQLATLRALLGHLVSQVRHLDAARHNLRHPGPQEGTQCRRLQRGDLVARHPQPGVATPTTTARRRRALDLDLTDTAVAVTRNPPANRGAKCRKNSAFRTQVRVKDPARTLATGRALAGPRLCCCRGLAGRAQLHRRAGVHRGGAPLHDTRPRNGAGVVRSRTVVRCCTLPTSTSARHAPRGVTLGHPQPGVTTPTTPLRRRRALALQRLQDLPRGTVVQDRKRRGWLSARRG